MYLSFFCHVILFSLKSIALLGSTVFNFHHTLFSGGVCDGVAVLPVDDPAGFACPAATFLMMRMMMFLFCHT